MATHAARSEATRGALVAAGRELFGERGFAASPLDEVVRRAGVTKGALYHHFANKEALFLAVFEDVEARVAGQVSRAAAQFADPRVALRAGVREFVVACRDPAVQLILIQDAPAVLGYEVWRTVDACHFAALLHRGLAAALSGGRREDRRVALLAQVLRGALTEAARVAGQDGPDAPTLGTVLDVVDDLIDGLLPAPVPATAG